MEKLFPEYKKYLTITLAGLILAYLFIQFPAPTDRILNIQNSLITVAGILSGFAIAYLSAKIFNIRAERESRQAEIDKYSEKITDFRRLLYFTMKSHKFWVYYEDIAKFKRKYPGITFQMLHHQQPTHEYAKAVWHEQELSISTIDLYCAMMAIYGDPDDFPDRGWALDKFATFNYSIDSLIEYYDPSNQIWYYLDGRYAKHGVGRFNDTGMNILWERYVKELLPKFNPKYKGAEFHREILADIAADIYEIIPTLIGITRKNTGVPKILLKTFNSLLAVMGFGVIVPLVIQSLEVYGPLNTFFTLACVWSTVLAIIVFLLDFFDFLEKDVHVTDSQTDE